MTEWARTRHGYTSSFFYLPAYWQTEGVTVVGGATGAKHGGEAVRALSPPALAPKRGTPNDVTSGQAFILGAVSRYAARG